MQNQRSETCWHNRRVNVKRKGCPVTCKASIFGGRVSLEWEWIVTATPRKLCPSKKEGVPVVQEVGRASGPDRENPEKTPPTGVRTPGRPARSESLHQEFYNTEHKYYSRTFGRDLRKIISLKKSKSEGIWRCHSRFTSKDYPQKWSKNIWAQHGKMPSG